MPSLETNDSRRRIIGSAASLFSKGGYRGASTREIAQLAGLNEATLFRHFPRKHDLYLAVLESELQGVRLRGDLLMALANAPDANAALVRTFDLVSAMFVEKQELIRFLQFGALELGKAFDPLLRKYLGELIEVIASYLQRWIDRGELRCSNARAVVLTFIAIVLNYRSLFAVFSDDLPGVPATLDMHADVYRTVTALSPGDLIDQSKVVGKGRG